jgi:hypothetical protein
MEPIYCLICILQNAKHSFMRKHNGMRPLDVVVLLKIAALEKTPWLQKDLAQTLHVSNSEIGESLNRSRMAGLLDDTRQRLMRQALLDFLQYGLRPVFPVQPNGLVRGVPTAHSAPLFTGQFVSQVAYVWADPNGSMMGQQIEPLYATVPLASLTDECLYGLLACADMLRLGRSREVQTAMDHLSTQLRPYAHA